MTRITRFVIAVAACAAAAGVAQADTIVIDSTTVGTVYDGVLDGVPPFPPPGAPPDGIADSQNTGLAVALKAGVVEERGIAEFPLAPLAGIDAADVVSATLTFNIDDVIGLFWPGAAFDNVASERIIVFAYGGNGVVELADFANVAGAPAGVVDTTPLGVITDATLDVSGPLQFHVDITNRVQALLAANATHLGIVFLTDDENSATSIDDLGAGGAGPPGVGGAILPLVTVQTVAAEPPIWDKGLRGCQQVLARGTVKLAATVTKNLATCFDGVLAATAKGDPLTKVTAKCGAALAPDTPGSKVGKAIGTLTSAVTKKCAAVTPAWLGTPCDAGATTMADVASCLVTRTLSASSRTIAAAYGPACALISAVGLEADYPAVCN